ncbi:tRNA (guanosine(37)-N1)-methyltransferase TrmD [Acetobacterium sp.]|jgi:tRNA (guanine37-N1)-methyltransferase|uniref:tRNA (guanosine(37)-N1)-methyltransferase TrmD n=1 Tax=Acetobacterium sp. TaxID=1872094 RepID=UPI00271DF283|nr:tRNA (guanosine(37)-N1)-methyltransferase TrmD [Acetobacterium sp.]MDO9491636.1 tRNA (guanosine(37)-N1)-methyltransferase TrmD [Acetobacterium sp.]
MRYYFLTLFPEIFETYFQSGMIGRGVKAGLIDYTVINIRDFSDNKHHKVDDTPYGGGAGMVMAAPPIVAALKSIPDFSNYPVIYLTPGGKPFEQKDGLKLSEYSGIIFICGHYEGIDQRVIDGYVDLEFSVGDYVLTGGELPALTLADAIARHIPGFLGNCDSLAEESFESHLLEYPHYTKPREFEGEEVPEVLLSGNHAEINKWRLNQAETRTRLKRPDLFEKYKKTQKT